MSEENKNEEQFGSSLETQGNLSPNIPQNFKPNKGAEYSTPPEGLAKAGAIINIVCAAIWLPFSLLFCLVLAATIIGIPFAIAIAGLNIWAIVANAQFLKGRNNKTTAGVLGLFASLIGGIFILIS